MKFSLTIFSFFFLPSSGFAQSIKTIDSLAIRYQICLDKGEFMYDCSNFFYNQMDSLLNLRYKQLRALCDAVQLENLKDDQLDWLSKRDKQFIKNQKQVNKAAKKDGYEGGQDEAMILMDINAKFVKNRVIELVNRSQQYYADSNYVVNPTGYYTMNDIMEIKDGEKYGYFGDIEVKQLSKKEIVIRLFVCKGAPSYNSGTLLDTILFKNNKAVYTTVDDTTCKITFTFYKRKISVDQEAEDPNNACGFGHAVFADGYYRKQNSKVPTDKVLNDK
jgi:uncharacterized protein YecT (DUF1311 family)